jgi:hypothetical protein
VKCRSNQAYYLRLSYLNFENRKVAFLTKTINNTVTFSVRILDNIAAILVRNLDSVVRRLFIPRFQGDYDPIDQGSRNLSTTPLQATYKAKAG